MLKTEDVLEILSIPLLGIIPESQDVLKASNVGAPVTINSPTSVPAKAYMEAARRLRGEKLEVTRCRSARRRTCSACCSVGGRREAVPLLHQPEAVSAPQARERLQILLAHERALVGRSDLVAILREEILKVIAKHVAIDSDKVRVKMDKTDTLSTLEVDLEIRAPATTMPTALAS